MSVTHKKYDKLKAENEALKKLLSKWLEIINEKAEVKPTNKENLNFLLSLMKETRKEVR